MQLCVSFGGDDRGRGSYRACAFDVFFSSAGVCPRLFPTNTCLLRSNMEVMDALGRYSDFFLLNTKAMNGRHESVLCVFLS